MAVPIVTLNDVAENLRVLCQVSADMSELSGVIHDYQITHVSTLSPELTPTQRNDLLRLLTSVTVALNPDLNCYPRGYVDTLLFDINGDPVT